jgi:hypothetical protein
LTDWQCANIRGQFQALDPEPTIIVIRNDTHQKWDDTLANPGQGLPALRTCNEGE